MTLKQNCYNISEVAKAIDKAFGKDINFYAYRLPNSSDANFGASFRRLNQIESTGFLVSPFNENSDSVKWFIPHDFGIDLPADLRVYCDKYQINDKDTSYSDYSGQASDIIKYLKINDGKVVLSRIKLAEYDFKISDLFEVLCQNYPTAFVFCYHIKDVGYWIGASPELLLKRDGENVSTMALASTRPAGSVGDWSEKCIKEQRIVRDYIIDVFNSYGLLTTVSADYNKKAGKVEHICTDITAKIGEESDIWSMIESLSPTPALSGYPKESAISLIDRIELHDREYYGGYIGLIENMTEFALYVNLRSMCIDGKSCKIFVGGGLTSESDINDEWQETEIKSETLLSAINSCKKSKND